MPACCAAASARLPPMQKPVAPTFLAPLLRGKGGWRGDGGVGSSVVLWAASASQPALLQPPASAAAGHKLPAPSSLAQVLHAGLDLLYRRGEV